MRDYCNGDGRQEAVLLTITVEQLVLPELCRQKVVELAHTIPLGGHLRKVKTAHRILQWFYWLILYRDVARHCRICKTCQLDAAQRVPWALLIPLPVMSEPFERVAMDYATCYLEAVALRSVT